MNSILEVKFKNSDVFNNGFVVPWHPKLIQLALWICTLDIEVIFTSLYRPGENSVHGTNPLRGFDIRSWVIPHPEIIEDMTNKHWQYDPKRPEKKIALLHEVKDEEGIGQGIHFHFQVHPNTRKVSGSDI